MKGLRLFAGVLICVGLVHAGLVPAISEQAPTVTTSGTVPQWQTVAGGKMSFEVASIRPSELGAVTHAGFPLSDDDAFRPTGGLFTADSFTLITYITFAYKLSLSPDQRQVLLSQLPKWVATDRFTIQARAAANNPTKDQMRMMMQSLLADRFKLAVHFETQQVSVLALSLIKPGKLGPQLLPHAEGPPCDVLDNGATSKSSPVFPEVCNVFSRESTPDQMILDGSRNNTLAVIAPSFSGNLGRYVVDKTGLSGRFDFTIKWTPESGGAAASPDSGTTFLEALRDQLGLKVESTKAALDVLMVDHVERPTLN